jgi:hypothetical protein
MTTAVRPASSRSIPASPSRHEHVLEEHFLVVRAVVDAYRRIRPPAVDRVPAETNAERVVRVAAHGPEIRRPEKLPRRRRQAREHVVEEVLHVEQARHRGGKRPAEDVRGPRLDVVDVV